MNREQNYCARTGREGQAQFFIARFAGENEASQARARRNGGLKGIWTPDPSHAMGVLYQLSYEPFIGKILSKKVDDFYFF